MNGLVWLGRDLQYAVRSLLRDRGTVALALLALSLGIGAATVIFSVVYSLLIAAFPFADSSRVVHFYVQTPDGQGRSAWYPVHEFVDYRAQNEVFMTLLGGASMEVLYDLDNSTYRVRGAIIDPQALPVLGVQPILGRGMTDGDGAAEAPPTFLMSDRMWNERFNRDPHLIGRTLNLNGTMRTLIGVLPPRFLLHGADVFFPTTIGPGATNALIGGSGNAPLQVWTYGRLKDGVTPEQAAANMEVLARNQARQYPQRYPEGFRIAVVSLADAYTAASIKELVYILVGAVLMLLMIACSNVANLLLARATAREAELALRAGLGASRGRLMQLLLAESFVLAAAGTVVGGLLAFAGLQWVRATIPADALPAEMAIRFSGDALLATVGLTMFTTVLCGLVPAFRASRGDLHTRLMSSGKGVGLRSGRGALRTMLVAVQVTLAIVLLVGAGLMMRTFIALQQIEPGLDTENVLVGRFAFPQNQRRTPEDMRLFVQRVVEAVATLPGVDAVSPALSVPLLPGPDSPLVIAGTTPNAEWRTAIEFVGDGYFRTVGLPLVRGRLLSATDVDGARPVIVVNNRFVQAFLDGVDPLGRTVSFAFMNRGIDPGAQSLFEIVGVVGDARNGGLQEDIRPQVFLPYTSPGVQTSTILVRTRVDPLSLEHGVRQQIWGVDRGVALMNVTTLDDVLDRGTFAAPRFGVGLMATFAVVGLILAAVGVFSVMAYTVSLQTHDIGIRMAHGAEPQGVLRMIVWRGLRPIAAGVLVGLGASWWLSRVLANQIYGVATTDPWTFTGVAILLTIVAVLACIIPARRATRVSPLAALREQ